MRHRLKGRKLSRTTSHRASTLKSLATELFRNKKIKTTLAKAREARTFIEPLITKAKSDTVHARRHVAKFVEDKAVVQELFGEIISKIGDRPGGYTRIIKLGNRFGDAAEMAIIELVDYNQPETKKKTTKKTKTQKKKKVETKSDTPVSDDAETTTKSKGRKKKTVKDEAETVAPVPEVEKPDSEEKTPEENQTESAKEKEKE